MTGQARLNVGDWTGETEQAREWIGETEQAKDWTDQTGPLPEGRHDESNLHPLYSNF